MSNNNELKQYEAEYLAQVLSPNENGDSELPGLSFEHLFSSLWAWLLAAWDHLATWFTFLWQTAVVVVCLMIVLTVCCTCYTLYVAIANCYCPPLVTFSCLCPWLSLKSLRRRFALVSEPGRLKVAPSRAGLPPVIVQPAYPPTEVERALIERIAAILREQVPEVGDGV